MARQDRRRAAGVTEGRTKAPARRASARVDRTAVEAERRREGFYRELFTPEESADLARTEGERSLEDEIALLRVAIRRGVAAGEKLETISRSVQRLAQALKVERELRGDGVRNLEEALARVLDEIGDELGVGGGNHSRDGQG